MPGCRFMVAPKRFQSGNHAEQALPIRIKPKIAPVFYAFFAIYHPPRQQFLWFCLTLF